MQVPPFENYKSSYNLNNVNISYARIISCAVHVVKPETMFFFFLVVGYFLLSCFVLFCLYSGGLLMRDNYPVSIRLQFAERMREARKKKGLTQKQLGEQLGVSQSMIGQFESGKHAPRMDTVEKICKALDLDILADYAVPFDYDAEKKAVYFYPRIKEQAKHWNSQKIEVEKNILVESFLKLNYVGRRKALESVADLAQIQKYTTQDAEPQNEREEFEMFLDSLCEISPKYRLVLDPDGKGLFHPEKRTTEEDGETVCPDVRHVPATEAAQSDSVQMDCGKQDTP